MHTHRDIVQRAKVIDDVFWIGRPSEFILALVSGYPSIERLSRPLVMLQVQAFADDSGTEPPVWVLAGFLAPAASWALFSDEWDLALKEAQPHPIKYMKMQEANALQGDFLGYNEVERDRVLNKLWEIIDKYAEFGFLAYVTENYFHSFARRFAKTLDSPYLWLATSIMFGVINNEYKHGLVRHVDFIFDEQYGQEFDVINSWNYSRQSAPRKYRKRLGSPPTWRNEKYVRPLQAADMVAWSLRRGLVDSQSRERITEIWNQIPVRAPLILCHDSPPFEKWAEALEDFVTRAEGSLTYETAKDRSARRKRMIKAKLWP